MHTGTPKMGRISGFQIIDLGNPGRPGRFITASWAFSCDCRQGNQIISIH
jgi:hypothetical protein